MDIGHCPMSNVQCQMLILIFLLLNVCLKSVFSFSTVYISNLFQIYYKSFSNVSYSSFFLRTRGKLWHSLCALSQINISIGIRHSFVGPSCGAYLSSRKKKVSMNSKLIKKFCHGIFIRSLQISADLLRSEQILRSGQIFRDLSRSSEIWPDLPRSSKIW